MNGNSQRDDLCDSQTSGSKQGIIIHYQLDFHRDGNKNFYIWRHCPQDERSQPKTGVLVDFGDVYVPNFEIEKLVGCILSSAVGAASVAVFHCHSHNRQDIKRKLKASDIKLYSKTAFFSYTEQATLWLKAQVATAHSPGG